MTSLDQERKEQEKWPLKPEHQQFGRFNKMLENEFLDQQQQATDTRLRRVIDFAAENVPFYGRRFAEHGYNQASFGGAADLPTLPELNRADVQDNPQSLLSKTLPPGHRRFGATKTSATTGHPVRVVQTNISSFHFTLLKQRESRWFRFNPSGSFAAIRQDRNLPRIGGQPLPVGKTLHTKGWRYVGRYFETGSYYCYNMAAALDDQLSWLKKIKPQYLMSLSAHLEHLALSCQDRSLGHLMDGVMAISQQLTDDMEQLVGTAFNTTVAINYGLNEIGLVAARCPEGGRYHVHTEHCLIEIVDADGNQCQPGEGGRLLVTSLSNLAMPLIRYDTGDLAQVPVGPCPCGRTLDAFVDIQGRYQRIAKLPPGAWDQFQGLRAALYQLPKEFVTPLRQYQLHHNKSGAFELRMVLRAKLPFGFENSLLKLWRGQLKGVEPTSLEIHIVDRLQQNPSGKFESFTSDYF